MGKINRRGLFTKEDFRTIVDYAKELKSANEIAQALGYSKNSRNTNSVNAAIRTSGYTLKAIKLSLMNGSDPEALVNELWDSHLDFNKKRKEKYHLTKSKMAKPEQTPSYNVNEAILYKLDNLYVIVEGIRALLASQNQITSNGASLPINGLTLTRR